MASLLVIFTVVLVLGLGALEIDVYRLRHGPIRGAVARLVGGVGRAAADLWRETAYANRRLIELQQPWRDAR